MPRLPRAHVPGGVCHVTLRGNHRQPIFAAAADRARLVGLIGDSLRRYARAGGSAWKR